MVFPFFTFANLIVLYPPNGEVTNCTVKDALKWKNNGIEIELPANTVISFTEQGAAAVTE